MLLLAGVCVCARVSACVCVLGAHSVRTMEVEGQRDPGAELTAWERKRLSPHPLSSPRYPRYHGNGHTTILALGQLPPLGMAPFCPPTAPASLVAQAKGPTLTQPEAGDPQA